MNAFTEVRVISLNYYRRGKKLTRMLACTIYQRMWNLLLTSGDCFLHGANKPNIGAPWPPMFFFKFPSTSLSISWTENYIMTVIPRLNAYYSFSERGITGVVDGCSNASSVILGHFGQRQRVWNVHKRSFGFLVRHVGWIVRNWYRDRGGWMTEALSFYICLFKAVPTDIRAWMTVSAHVT